MCFMCCVYMHMCVQRIFTFMCYMCMSIAVYILWMGVCICMHVCVLCDMCLHMLGVHCVCTTWVCGVCIMCALYVHVRMCVRRCMCESVCVWCVNVYPILCRCVHMYKWSYGGQRSKSVVFLSCPLSCFLRRVFHWTWHSLTAWKAWTVSFRTPSVSALHQCWANSNISACSSISWLYLGIRDLNSSLYACSANALATEPSPQP